MRNMEDDLANKRRTGPEQTQADPPIGMTHRLDTKEVATGRNIDHEVAKRL